jgi:hypothetical protein
MFWETLATKRSSHKPQEPGAGAGVPAPFPFVLSQET